MNRLTPNTALCTAACRRGRPADSSVMEIVVSFLLAVLCAFLLFMASGCKSSSTGSGGQSSGAASTPPKPFAGRKVLLVHSYHRQYEWVAGITRGVKRILKPAGIDLRICYMDTKRNNDPQAIAAAAEKVLESIDAWQPAIVITADDNAQQYVGRFLVGPQYPTVVFCGVNASPEKYGFPAENITGIIERPHYIETLKLLRKLYPDLGKVALISDDSPTSHGMIEYIQAVPADVEIVSVDMTDDMSQWKSCVKNVQKKADAICIATYHTIADADTGQKVLPHQIMDWTVKNSQLPVVSLFTFGVDDGALCGATESAAEHGEQAAEVVMKILSGSKASDIPVYRASAVQTMVNLRTARRLGLDISAGDLDSIDILVGSYDVQ